MTRSIVHSQASLAANATTTWRMRRRRVAALHVCFLLALMLWSAPASAQKSEHDEVDFGLPIFQRSPAEPNLPAAEQQLFAATNAFRASQGLAPLRLSEMLTHAATYFADYMARHHKYGHTADDHEPWERAKMAGYDYCVVDENIAWELSSAGFSTADLAQRLIHAWENSPEHRKNLLDPDVVELGVGIAHDSESGKYYAVQDFGRPKSMATRFTLANESASEIKYKVGDKEFDLPTHYRMIHERCRSGPVVIHLAEDGKHDVEIRPTNGQQYTIRADDAGKLSVSDR